MTDDRDRKRLARERAVQTGEPYALARRNVIGADASFVDVRVEVHGADGAALAGAQVAVMTSDRGASRRPVSQFLIGDTGSDGAAEFRVPVSSDATNVMVMARAC